MELNWSRGRVVNSGISDGWTHVERRTMVGGRQQRKKKETLSKS